MRARTVLILLVLVVALVAFIELYEGDRPSSRERVELGKRVLGDLEAEEIEAIEIAWQSVTTRLERQAPSDDESEGWMLTAPLAGHGDEEATQSLIETLIELEKNRTLDDIDRAAAGLEPPRLVATLITASGDIQLEVGSEVPAGSSMIVGVGGEMYVVDDALWQELARAPGEWRSRKVVRRTEDEITRISLSGGVSPIEFARRGGDFWIESPTVDRADAERVGSLLAELASMEIADFVDDPRVSREEMGLNPPVGVIEIGSESDGPVSRIRWGESAAAEGKRRYAESENQVFTTESDLQQFLQGPLEEWRSKDLTSMETYEIDRLTIEQADNAPLILVRDGADWRRNEDSISFTTVSELLYAITGLKAARVVDSLPPADRRSATSDPVLRVSMEGSEKKQSASFFAASDGQVQAEVEDRSVVLFLADNEFSEVLGKLDAVRAVEGAKIDDDEQLINGAN